MFLFFTLLHGLQTKQILCTWDESWSNSHWPVENTNGQRDTKSCNEQNVINSVKTVNSHADDRVLLKRPSMHWLFLSVQSATQLCGWLLFSGWARSTQLMVIFVHSCLHIFNFGDGGRFLVLMFSGVFLGRARRSGGSLMESRLRRRCRGGRHSCSVQDTQDNFEGAESDSERDCRSRKSPTRTAIVEKCKCYGGERHPITVYRKKSKMLQLWGKGTSHRALSQDPKDIHGQQVLGKNIFSSDWKKEVQRWGSAASGSTPQDSISKGW